MKRLQMHCYFSYLNCFWYSLFAPTRREPLQSFSSFSCPVAPHYSEHARIKYSVDLCFLFVCVCVFFCFIIIIIYTYLYLLGFFFFRFLFLSSQKTNYPMVHEKRTYFLRSSLFVPAGFFDENGIGEQIN